VLVTFEIEGLSKLQKQFEDAGRAFEALDGEITAVQFNTSDQASLEAAIADLERTVDAKIAAFAGNPIVDTLARQLRDKYRQHIMERAMDATGNGAAARSPAGTANQSLFRQIENTVTDLRRTDQNTFPRHIKRLSRLLREPDIEPITTELDDTANLNAFIEAGNARRGSMVGSAQLDWPSDQKQELGLVIKLVDRFAEKPDEAMQFSFRFYHSGNSIAGNLQNMVAQMIVPFARDYIDYVKSVTGAWEVTLLPQRTEPAARKAFVVHGHDEGAREAVARFLERIGFEAVILHEQANQGRTVIEKIEAHGDVGFAVVLLTPDDEGCKKGGSPQSRARQNVVLELGYFIGRLGRSRVCALTRGDVEIPSDFQGVVYEKFDESNGWKAALGKELQALGFEIGWNLVYGQ
jgi:Predicted nucleotide-binding protein containing TIR-like domain